MGLHVALKHTFPPDSLPFDISIMAELVGIIGSSIGIAQLAKGIVTASFKVKELLDEIKDVPKELQRYLGQIQLLAPLLADINDDGPPALGNALRTAVAQCQQAAEELRKLAEDLQMRTSSGSKTRRKLRTVKVVLQKDTLAKHEKRLSAAMQMLSLAFQMYSHAR